MSNAPIIDINKLSVGDVVHVRGRVERVGRDTVRVSFAAGLAGIIDLVDIVHAQPRPIAVGDMVTAGPDAPRWEVRAIEDGVAWLLDRPGGRRRTTADVSMLLRVDR